MSDAVKRVVIVDDEPAARAQLRDVIQSMPELEIVEEVSDGRSAIESITEHGPDIVFLDIDMPSVDGFAVARATEHIPFQLVFVTAHHDYALQAFETQAIDYLLKPARPSLIARCLAKILRQEVLTLRRQTESPATGSLVLADRNEDRVIQAEHVLYIEGLGRYRRVHLTAEGVTAHEMSTVLSDTTLDEFAALLGDQAFMRVHRSYLVNLSTVTALKSSSRQYHLRLSGLVESVPVARARVKDLKAALGAKRQVNPKTHGY
ncbi:MAG: LytTR family DNA-binding domain-containing protein [Pseudomonadota bacterium]